MPVYLWGGPVLTVGGAVAVAEACCCGGGPPQNFPCLTCDMPYQLCATFEGSTYRTSPYAGGAYGLVGRATLTHGDYAFTIDGTSITGTGWYGEAWLCLWNGCGDNPYDPDYGKLHLRILLECGQTGLTVRIWCVGKCCGLLESATPCFARNYVQMANDPGNTPAALDACNASPPVPNALCYYCVPDFRLVEDFQIPALPNPDAAPCTAASYLKMTLTGAIGSTPPCVHQSIALEMPGDCPPETSRYYKTTLWYDLPSGILSPLKTVTGGGVDVSAIPLPLMGWRGGGNWTDYGTLSQPSWTIFWDATLTPCPGGVATFRAASRAGSSNQFDVTFSCSAFDSNLASKFFLASTTDTLKVYDPSISNYRNWNAATDYLLIVPDCATNREGCQHYPQTVTLTLESNCSGLNGVTVGATADDSLTGRPGYGVQYTGCYQISSTVAVAFSIALYDQGELTPTATLVTSAVTLRCQTWTVNPCTQTIGGFGQCTVTTRTGTPSFSCNPLVATSEQMTMGTCTSPCTIFGSLDGSVGCPPATSPWVIIHLQE